MRLDRGEEAMEERGIPSRLWCGIWGTYEISLDSADHARDLLSNPPRAVLRASPGPHGSRPVGFSFLGRSRWLPVVSFTSEPERTQKCSSMAPAAGLLEGRWVIESWRSKQRWEIIVEPDPEEMYLVVVTAFPIED
jgi:hypothetical protein